MGGEGVNPLLVRQSDLTMRYAAFCILRHAEKFGSSFSSSRVAYALYKAGLCYDASSTTGGPFLGACVQPRQQRCCRHHEKSTRVFGNPPLSPDMKVNCGTASTLSEHHCCRGDIEESSKIDFDRGHGTTLCDGTICRRTVSHI